MIKIQFLLKLLMVQLIVLNITSCQKLKSLNTNKQDIIEQNLDENKTIPSFSLTDLVKKNKNGEVIYVDENTPKFSYKDCFYPYIKEENSELNLYLKLQHVDVEPLDISSYIITVDKVDYQIKGTVSQEKINGKKKYTVETLNKKISSDTDLETLEAIAKGTHLNMVLVGKNRFVKKGISKKMQIAFINVLGAYLHKKNN